MLQESTILRLAPGVVARPRGHQVLLFQSLSDEMFLVTQAGHGVIELCDGMRSVRAIATCVVAASSEPDKVVYGTVLQFLGSLVERNVLAIVRTDAQS